MTLRFLSTDGEHAPASEVLARLAAEPKPGTGWIQLADCVVDESYQREISAAGWRNIRRIVAAFEWRKFAPLIVAPAHEAPGKWAIVDGQHRATAALICALPAAPAMIVKADRAAQAAMFNAINAVVTPVSALTAHAAAIAAGEPAAVALAEVCAAAGVTVCKYPVPAEKMTPGQTLAIGVLKRCLAQFGRETLITALQCVTETENNFPGAVCGLVIKGLCMTLHKRPAWRDAGEALFAAMDDIALDELIEFARTGRGGGDGASRLAERLDLELARRMISAGGGKRTSAAA